jgi:CRISPR system Cascade subunit CasE
MHKTLCRAFSRRHGGTFSHECTPFLWRLEPATDSVIVQSCVKPCWADTGPDWMAGCDTPRDIAPVYRAIPLGATFRFRLLANPCTGKNGKRCGIDDPTKQTEWLIHQGGYHGFKLKSVEIVDSNVIRGRKGDGTPDVVFRYALFEGVMNVTEAKQFQNCLVHGIGKAKAFGCGLLSLAS